MTAEERKDWLAGLKSGDFVGVVYERRYDRFADGRIDMIEGGQITVNIGAKRYTVDYSGRFCNGRVEFKIVPLAEFFNLMRQGVKASLRFEILQAENSLDQITPERLDAALVAFRKWRAEFIEGSRQ